MVVSIRGRGDDADLNKISAENKQLIVASNRPKVRKVYFRKSH